MKNLAYLPLIVVIAAICIYVLNEFGSKQYTGVIKSDIDTVWTKPDTVIISIVKTVHLPGDIDTLYIDSTEVITARADTTFSEDSSSIDIQYFFPPHNYFKVALDIKEKIIRDTVKITELREVEVMRRFYADHWFWSTLLIAGLFIANLFGG